MIKLGVIMDPIQKINYKKDTTLAMLWEAKRRHWSITYIEQQNLFFLNNEVFANTQKLEVFQDKKKWYQLEEQKIISICDLDVILMRKDPPFNLEYIYTTYLLEHAEKKGVLVVNKPQSLRDVNEKLFTIWFPDCCPPMIVTKDIALLREFYLEHQDIVCKPPYGMGGASVFRLKYPDQNATVVFETLTQYGTLTVIAQRYIPEIINGDKRIIMLDGKPVDYALSRIPGVGEWRGNLAAGAQGMAQPLSKRDYTIAKRVGPVLKEKGLYFVGLDIIGDYLTEVNVTSPTCVREIDQQCKTNISKEFFDIIEKKLKH